MSRVPGAFLSYRKMVIHLGYSIKIVSLNKKNKIRQCEEEDQTPKAAPFSW
jgi:hypothetical protein